MKLPKRIESKSLRVLKNQNYFRPTLGEVVTDFLNLAYFDETSWIMFAYT